GFFAIAVCAAAIAISAGDCVDRATAVVINSSNIANVFFISPLKYFFVFSFVFFVPFVVRKTFQPRRARSFTKAAETAAYTVYCTGQMPPGWPVHPSCPGPM